MKLSKLIIPAVCLLLCDPLAAAAETVADTELAANVEAAAAAPDLSPEAVYSALISCKAQYPEGMAWTNDNYYRWEAAGINAYGCYAFAGILSDAAFGDLPARFVYDITEVRPGDMLRIGGDMHSVIVLEVLEDSVVLAEGNYGGKIHWGRTMPLSDVFGDETDYMITRYPATLAEPPAGDLDGDSTLTVADAVLLMRVIAEDMPENLPTGAQLTAADLNADGMLTVADYAALLQLL